MKVSDACEYDVVIMGAGLAGLTLALQIHKARATTKIALVEKNTFPFSEERGKVGESCVELAAHYFDNVLGIHQHLEEAQLPKLGLRYFLEHGSELKINERLEIGNNKFAPTPSYQLERSRFENFLYQHLSSLGIEIVTGCRVREIDLGEDSHRIRVAGENSSRELTSRWLVDASGRAGVLRKQLGLNEKTSHQGTSCWWRLEGEFRVDDWCKDPAWGLNNQGDVARWFSTNHLMGQGYWVWIIPLATGATSFGIVADPNYHSFSDLHTFDKAISWLEEHEAELAQLTKDNRDKVRDFAAIKNYSYGCKKVFSSQRWALTGEAGLFIDPFYSPGSDFIAISNTYVCDLIIRDLEQEGINLRADLYNELYLRFTNSSTSTFEGQYEIIGNPVVLPVKVYWDWCFYWHFLARLYFEDKICDLRFIANSRTLFERFAVLGDTMQALFNKWNKLERPTAKGGFLDLGAHPYLFDLNKSLSMRDKTQSFEDCFSSGLEQLESLSREIAQIIRRRTGVEIPEIAARKQEDVDIIASFFSDLESFLIDSPSATHLSKQVGTDVEQRVQRI